MCVPNAHESDEANVNAFVFSKSSSQLLLEDHCLSRADHAASEHNLQTKGSSKHLRDSVCQMLYAKQISHMFLLNSTWWPLACMGCFLDARVVKVHCKTPFHRSVLAEVRSMM